MRATSLRNRRALVVLAHVAFAGLAGAAGLAHAQSSVTLYGNVDAYLGYSKPPGTASGTGMLGGGGMSTSIWGIRGTEDLGGGRSAMFVLESFFRPESGAAGRFTGDTFFSRNAYVALRDNSMGQVRIGRMANPYFLSIIRTNPFRDSTTLSPTLLQSYIPNGSLLATVTGDTIWNNVVAYATPEFGGVSATAMYSFGQQPGDMSRNKFGLQVVYASQKATVAASYVQMRFNATPMNDINVPPGFNKQQAFFVGGSYDFGPVRVYADYQNVSTDATFSSRNQGGRLGVSVPIGDGAVLASYGITHASTGDVGQTRNTWALAYEYYLSKRTSLYTAYLSDKASNVSRGSLATLGMAHRF